MITISSNSLDELNSIYKKIKKDFEATEGIKLNQDSMEYELILVKPCLDLATRSILEKVLDNIELLEEQSLLKNMDWEKLTTEMEEKLTIISLKPLQVTWPDLSTDRRNASFVYLCKELKIETKQSEEKISI
ncbi:MAG: hypothetical protein ACJAR4_001674 [Psychroserpens sp.]|jgi:hypothetical protein